MPQHPRIGPVLKSESVMNQTVDLTSSNLLFYELLLLLDYRPLNICQNSDYNKELTNNRRYIISTDSKSLFKRRHSPWKYIIIKKMK